MVGLMEARTDIDARHVTGSRGPGVRIVRSQRGVAAVEMALVLPVLLSVLLGIVSVGDYFLTAHLVQQSASDAARAALAGLDAPERRTIAIATAQRMLNSTGVLRADRGRIETIEKDNILTVSIQYDASADPLLNLPFVPALSRKMTATSAAMLGGLS
ncbi:TadE/TadG family type IV pilus assembly protein [Sphingomonas sp. Marseille-Q8236]